MDNILSVLVTSVLSSSVIVTIIELARSKIDNKAKYVSYERTRTDVSKKLRELISKVYSCNKRLQLLELLPEIKSCINPYDFSKYLFYSPNKRLTVESIEHDVLLWDAIFQLEYNTDDYDDDNKFNNIKMKIALYISCWLKHDWDRYHHEINNNDKQDYRQKYIDAMCHIHNTKIYSKDTFEAVNEILDSKTLKVDNIENFNTWMLLAIVFGTILLDSFIFIIFRHCLLPISFLLLLLINISLVVVCIINVMKTKSRNDICKSWPLGLIVAYILHFIFVIFCYSYFKYKL